MKKFAIIITVVFLAGISSCVKEKFGTEPVTNTDPNITANTSIAALNAMATSNGVQITQSLILSAIVVGDDKSGNFYKELDIEDSTGGILLMINGDDLYATYPAGRRLFINLQGLYVVKYDSASEIVGSIDNGAFTGIATSNLSQYVNQGKWGINVAPIAVTIPELVNHPYMYQGELVQLNNVEFASGYRGVPYANATYELSSTMIIKDCNENTDSIYTSGYASFASAVTPSGNGTLVCVAGVYGGSSGVLSQLMIRDTTDLHLTGPLCP
jgi:hypothetical protein